MRRKDREIDAQAALAVVDKCGYGVLSMVSREGRPYCVPLSIVREEDRIYFHCATQGEKTELLRENPQVCMACVGNVCPVPDKFTTEYESAIVRGTAEEVLTEEEKIHALLLLCRRHTPSNMEAFDGVVANSLACTAVWSIRIESVTGKQNKGKL